MEKKVGIVVVIGVMLLGTSTLAGINAPFLESTEKGCLEKITLSAKFSSPKSEEHHEYLVIDGSNDMTYLMHEGSPILPFKTEVLTFPAGTKIVRVDATTSDVHTMQLDKKLQPAPKPVPYNMEYAHVEITGGEIYQSSELYPSDWVSYHIGVGIEGDEHVIVLSIHAYPVRYMPLTNELHYVGAIEIEVIYETPSQPLFMNDAYDLVIIAPSEFSDALQPLVNHKESYGVATKLVTLDEIYGGNYFAVNGRDDAEKVKYFIKNVVEEWGIHYVMLVGGRHGGMREAQWWCPVRYAYLDVGDDDKCFLSDLYFADFYKYDDGEIAFEDWDSNANSIFGEWNYGGKDIVDMHPDVCIGRLACRTEFEVTIMVEKIIAYETAAYGQSWSKRHAGIGGDTFSGDEWYDGEETVAQVIGYLGPLGYDFTTLFTSDGTLAQGKDIINAVNEGCGFLQFEGHGTPTSWATHNPQSEEWDVYINEISFTSFENKDMYPVCVVGGCSNSKFDITVLDLLDLKNLKATLEHGSAGLECFSWWMTRKIDGGSIATIGCTSYGYGKRGDSDHDGIFDGIQYRGGFIDIQFFRMYAQEGKGILGEAHAAAITSYLTKFPPMTDKIDGKTVEEWALLGDPSLKIGGYP